MIQCTGYEYATIHNWIYFKNIYFLERNTKDLWKYCLNLQ